MKTYNLSSLFFLFAIVSAEIKADNISNIIISPVSPSTRAFNHNVDVTFDYNTEESGGVRIFVRPFTNGELTPNYAAHASPLYPSGSGTGTGFFTIISGDTEVDSIRFTMFNGDQSQLLLEFFIPVKFYYSNHAIYNISLTPETSLSFNQDINITFDYTTNEPGGVRIFPRPFTDGALTPNYAAQGSGVYPSGSGSGSSSFTITSGEAHIDSIRFIMTNGDQSTTLLEYFLPVDYFYLNHSISNVKLDPVSPASLTFDQDINITFNYSTIEPGGVRIFARPFTNGELSPNYAAHASPIYPVGNGTGSGRFTITEDDIEVDSIRFIMYNADQSIVLLEHYIAVKYIYSVHSISNISLTPLWPAYFSFNQEVSVNFDYSTSEAGGVRIFVRPFTDGALTPNYAAHASPLYPVGNGTGTGLFTITSGDTEIDSINFTMLNSDQSSQLLQFYLPVSYFYNTITDIAENNLSPVKEYYLSQNFPNPFNPGTHLRYAVSVASFVSLKVYDLLGNEVAVLVNEEKPAGEYEIAFDGSGLSSGVYFYRLKTKNFTDTKKFILMK